MATLVKQHNRYALQFYDKERKPKRKRVALKTSIKRTATTRQVKLEHDYINGKFDPWTMDAFSYDKQECFGKSLTINKAFQLFIERKERNGCKPDTLRTYREVVELFIAEVGAESLIASIKPTQIDSFVRTKGLAQATQRKRYRQLRVFIRWCLQEEIIVSNPLKKVTIPEAGAKVPKSFSLEELGLICKAVEKDYQDKLAKNHAREGQLIWLVPLFRFTFFTGMRLSEVGRLKWGHIDFEKRLIYIHRQKNKKAQTIPLNAKADEVLEKLERGEENEYVFTSPSQKNATSRKIRRFREYVSRMFTRYRKEAKIERQITFHSLRHSFCTMLAEAGKSGIVIKEAARHADISTSMRYVHLSNQHLKAELDDVFA